MYSWTKLQVYTRTTISLYLYFEIRLLKEAEKNKVIRLYFLSHASTYLFVLTKIKLILPKSCRDELVQGLSLVTKIFCKPQFDETIRFFIRVQFGLVVIQKHVNRNILYHTYWIYKQTSFEADFELREWLNDTTRWIYTVWKYLVSTKISYIV